DVSEEAWAAIEPKRGRRPWSLSFRRENARKNLSPCQSTRSQNPFPTADLRHGRMPAKIQQQQLVVLHRPRLAVASPEQATGCSCRAMETFFRRSDRQLAG